jgi:hypothetical protein
MRELFELFGLFYFEDFSDVCNETGSYLFLVLIILSITILFNISYYLILDSSIFNRTQYYYFLLFISSILVFFISYNFLYIQISSQSLVFPRIGFLTVSFLSSIYSYLFYFLESIFFKNFSKNSYRIPF